MHGYGVYDQIRRWPLDRSLIPERTAIYRAVSRLARDGLIESVSVGPSEGSDHVHRTTWRVTSEGERRHREWLQSPPTTYEDLCLRLVAHRREDVPLVIEFLTAAEAACLARLEELKMPAVETLYARDVPWGHVAMLLGGKVEAGQVAGRWRVLRDLRRSLTALETAKPTRETGRRS
jgi:DNA-binding PadR family transcriptional regulator